MGRWLPLAAFSLLALTATGVGVWAQDKPSPKESFQKFIDAVLSDKGAADAARKADLDRCFDFEAWVVEKQKRDNAAFSAEDRSQLAADWATLLASDEFRDNWKRKGVRITVEHADGVEILLSESDGREQRVRIRMKVNAEGDLWRWYWSEPVGAAAADSSIPAPKTSAELLKAIAARLDEIAKAEGDLAAERAELLAHQRRLLAKLEEEQGSGPQGTPTALARAAGAALMASRWDDFAALHAAPCDAEARRRFDRQRERLNGWTVKDVAVTEPGRRALVSIEVGLSGKPSRVIALRAVKQDSRWCIDEAP